MDRNGQTTYIIDEHAEVIGIKLRSSMPEQSVSECSTDIQHESKSQTGAPEMKSVATQTEPVAIVDMSDFNPEDEILMQEFVSLMPNVVQHLRDAGVLSSFVKFNRLAGQGTFPMRNIAFLLFLDVAEWFSGDCTSGMRYKFPETWKFWNIGYKLFKGRWLRFMSGPKNKGDLQLIEW